MLKAIGSLSARFTAAVNTVQASIMRCARALYALYNPAPQIRLTARFNHMAEGLEPAAAPSPANTISEESSLRLFDYFTALSYMAYNYIPDGCYARAHLMCKEIQELSNNKLTPYKIWGNGLTDENKLTVNAGETRLADWYFHVAAALNVRMDNGETKIMVFDPSLFDGPAEVDEWQNTLNAEASQILLSPFGEDSPLGSKNGFYLDKESEPPADPDRYSLKILRHYKRSEPSSPPLKFTAQLRQKQASVSA